jgi:hypothetical protein
MTESFNPYDAWWTAIGHRADAFAPTPAYRIVGMGADETPPATVETDQVVLARVDKTSAALLQWTKDEDRRRKWTLVIAGASALFAAVKLGFIAIPHIRRHRSSIGRLDIAPAANPRRRRRRR